MCLSNHRCSRLWTGRALLRQSARFQIRQRLRRCSIRLTNRGHRWRLAVDRIARRRIASSRGVMCLALRSAPRGRNRVAGCERCLPGLCPRHCRSLLSWSRLRKGQVLRVACGISSLLPRAPIHSRSTPECDSLRGRRGESQEFYCRPPSLLRDDWRAIALEQGVL